MLVDLGCSRQTVEAALLVSVATGLQVGSCGGGADNYVFIPHCMHLSHIDRSPGLPYLSVGLSL